METPKRSLDVTNAEHIGYKYGGIEITVLGGIRLEGLDRLRVTEVANHLDTIRDRLVALVDHEEGYRETIRNDYTILGELRDILLHLQKQG